MPQDPAALRILSHVPVGLLARIGETVARLRVRLPGEDGPMDFARLRLAARFAASRLRLRGAVKGPLAR